MNWALFQGFDADSVFHFQREYIEKRNLIAWDFYDPKNPLHQVNVLINYDLKSSEVKMIQTASGKLSVLSLKALIAMKKASGRPQDLEDVKALEQL